jgi:hypothetical protein
MKARIPAWCGSWSVQVNGKPVKAATGTDGYAAVTRNWEKSDRLELQLKLAPRVVVGDHKNQGKVAVLYGPLVLAADEALQGDITRGLNSVSLAGADLPALGVTPEPAPGATKSWPGAQVFKVNAIARKGVGDLKAGSPLQVHLIPFAEAGGAGTSYKVWLPLGLATTSGNVLRDGHESRSRVGNVVGSINDEDLESFVVTFDNQPRAEDWFAVALDQPEQVSRVVFAQGQTFHDGGWFDASAGKPRIQVKAAKDAAWETAGELADYPATTATDPAGLKGGERFTGRLAKPVKVFAIRVLGKPACGDNPQQAFSSCAELQAFAEPR